MVQLWACDKCKKIEYGGGIKDCKETHEYRVHPLVQKSPTLTEPGGTDKIGTIHKKSTVTGKPRCGARPDHVGEISIAGGICEKCFSRWDKKKVRKMVEEKIEEAKEEKENSED